VPAQPRPEATLAAFGDLSTDRSLYHPLDRVTIRVTGRAKGDDRCFIRVEDAALTPYFEAEVRLHNNEGSATFPAAGQLGVHWIYLRFPDTEEVSAATACVPPVSGPNAQAPPPHPSAVPLYYASNFGRPDVGPNRKTSGGSRGPDWHVRYANFVLDAETTVQTGEEAYDTLYDITKRRLSLNRRVFHFPSGSMAYYCSADTWATSAAWLRDWIYHLPAARFWERELTGGLKQFTEVQQRDGILPDIIRYDGTTYRMSVESDLEYIAVMGVWGIWRITGDAEWLAAQMPMLEKSLAYIQSDPIRWDAERQLVTRGHTCDTWDFEIGGEEHFVGGRKVIATCDQSGYYLAYEMMAEMLASLGDARKSQEYAEKAESYRERANALLWDGVKYLHHVHRTPIKHPGFDESQQLAAGNTWAMSRGLATPEQAQSIIDEYKRRHERTGDAFPWWSLQPGYPDELNYWPDMPHCAQGGYANGGLLPYVGAELCRSCFKFGRERYGLELLKQYTDHLKATENRVYVWYWPNGEPGMRTANEVPRAGWGMAEWLAALLEGLAGFTDEAPRMARVRLAPRWAVTDCREAYVSVRYEVNDSYFAYRMKIDRDRHTLALQCAGSGESAQFHLLLPQGWKAVRILADGAPIRFNLADMGQSHYVDFTGKIDFASVIVAECAETHQG